MQHLLSLPFTPIQLLNLPYRHVTLYVGFTVNNMSIAFVLHAGQGSLVLQRAATVNSDPRPHLTTPQLGRKNKTSKSFHVSTMLAVLAQQLCE